MEEMQGSHDLAGDAGLQAHLSAGAEHQQRDPYLVKSVVHASQILAAFHDTSEVLPLKEIVRRCGLPKSMVFRLLYTMSTCHIVEKLQSNRYHLAARPADETPAPTAAPKKRRVSTARQEPPKDAPHAG
ncbi:IclR helix-turn-helix domain-containing protein [Terriglobus roseus]|uniref:IclR helix-turn-helix domain-containing protein n=2 Tax=Terriglobus roseus TaxID=392734 RepID=A0A1H4SNC2_9BACT|nr:IclR helix-turn-helix domain-containing protein [Terriglobus roseus]